MHHLSLFELNTLVKSALSENLEPSYWVVAEVGELRINQKGHCYLELVEKTEDALLAKTKATIWAYTYRNLSLWFESITHQSIQTGMKLLLNVQVQFHEVFGFSLNVRDIDPTYTLGEKEKQRQAVLDLLSKEGILRMNKELPLPLVPQRIAVISSPTAAGLEDFNHQLLNNKQGYFVRTTLFRAAMQGQEAIDSISKAIRSVFDFAEDFDLLVIIRGGGSQVDLDCYDSYEICSLIAQFPLPVLTGIGHERDETLTDLVAHTKMKTPTAVADFILEGLREFDDYLDSKINQLQELSEERIEEEKDKIETYSKLLSSLSASAIKLNKSALDSLGLKLSKEPARFLSDKIRSMESFEHRLRILDPISVLKRGFTITTIDNKLIKNIKHISPGSKMETQTAGQIINSIIKEVKENGQSN